MSTTGVVDKTGQGKALPANGVRTFAVVSAGQFVAVSGVTIFNFAGAFYFYGTHGVLIWGLLYALPFVVFVAASPLAGALIDRWGVRRALLACNLAGIVLVFTLAVVPFTHTPARWYAGIIILSVPCVKAMLLPAYEASVPMLVPKRHYGRANGMRMFINGIGAVLGPVAAVLLIHSVGIYGVGLLAFVCLGTGVLTLLPARIPLAEGESAPGAGMRALLADANQAWHYLRALPGLPALMLFFGVTSFAFGFVEVLLPTIVSDFAAPAGLDIVFVAAVAGMAVTGVAMTVWGGPRRRVRGMLGYQLLMAGAMVIGSLRPSIALMAVAGLIFLGSTSIIVGNIQTILCLKVEPQMLGRVMGWKNAVYGVFLQIGDILAGVSGGITILVMSGDHFRLGVVATVVGNGPGRGLAVVLLTVGVLVAVCSVLVAHRHRPMRDVEDLLPDVTPEDAALTTAQR